MPVVTYRNPLAVRLRDPFIYRVDQRFHMIGTTRPDGIDGFWSDNLVDWTRVEYVYRQQEHATWNQSPFWAPECYRVDGLWYLFYTAKSPATRRAVGVALADGPLGPFRDLDRQPLTNPDWECLDGHLYEHTDGYRYLFYVHEWTQITDGTMVVQRISDDLTRLVDEPVRLFGGSACRWNRKLAWAGLPDGGWVVDGPSLVVADGLYHLMWSCFGEHGYAATCATATSPLGPYEQSQEMLVAHDGGHTAWFTLPDGTLMVSYHSPNQQTECLHIDRLTVDGGRLRLDESRGEERVLRW